MPQASYLETHISQIPALRLLMALGWEYLSPAQANTLRGGKTGDVILEGVLRPWLAEHNRIHYQGREHAFSDANLSTAITQLKDVPLQTGLVNASADVYERLTLGTTLKQPSVGTSTSFTLHYIDWHDHRRNVFHVTEEFSVQRQRVNGTARPDIVLFVNGIPLAVIECKRPDQTTQDGRSAIHAGIEQMRRNQGDEYIPRLFAYAQLLLAVNTNDARYGATGARPEYWATWQEEGQQEADVSKWANRLLTDTQKAALYDWREYGRQTRAHFEAQDAAGPRLVTAQDRAIAALLRRGRLLELAYQYTVYDNGAKKIARYQQYFAIQATLQRIQARDAEGARPGGVIWHTTGSGKSLTMVMLAKALAITLGAQGQRPRVVIVVDRVDLDQQIWKTFRQCGKEVQQAKSGKDLARLIRGNQADIITTVVDKFEGAKKEGTLDTGTDIFLLVDEGHRGQHGTAAAMRQRVFPNACTIAFTGTPLTKDEKSTAAKFGGFIHKYTMRQAVADGAVVPLLYEGRLVELDADRDALDRWFERRTQGLTDDQKADLKRKMSRNEEVQRVPARLAAIAYDIAQHYTTHWRGTGFKAQLATSSKEEAVQYLALLEAEGIRCQVVMSAPDTREGTTDEDKVPAVTQFWNRMMRQYRNDEATYLREVKQDFHEADGVELLIVVDKLLVGFDEPRNTVLYIDKPLREHGLLQAIARVNRVFPGKTFGHIVDYRGVLGDLNEALDTYNALEGYDAEDVAGTVTDIRAELDRLSAYHAQLYALFNAVGGTRDGEAMERHLAPEDIRQRFYTALNDYAAALRLALGVVSFYDDTPKATIDAYKRDLKFFDALRTSVRLRYAESVNYSEYEKHVRRVLGENVRAGDVTVLTQQVNIFDEEAFAQAVEQMQSNEAKADMIGNQLIKTATEQVEQNPAFFRRFSQMVADTIAAYRDGRLTELEYLQRMQQAHDTFLNEGADTLPAALVGARDAGAYYELLREALGERAATVPPDAQAALALEAEAALNRHKVRDWQNDVNEMRDALDGVLYALTDAYPGALADGEHNRLVEAIIETARHRDALPV